MAEAVKHARQIKSEVKRAQTMDATELYTYAKELRVSYQLLKKTAELGRLPVVNFAAGGLGKYCCVALYIVVLHYILLCYSCRMLCVSCEVLSIFDLKFSCDIERDFHKEFLS